MNRTIRFKRIRRVLATFPLMLLMLVGISGVATCYAATTWYTDNIQFHPLQPTFPGQQQQLTIWADGTLGFGSPLVAGASNAWTRVNSGESFNLPESAGGNGKYTLHGWYDIYNKQWYEPGASVSVTEDTVFYADWWLASYDRDSITDLAEGQCDTSSFLKTEVFDYNELFNPEHGVTLSTNQTGFPTSPWQTGRNLSQGHSESWRDAGGDSFLFLNWYYFRNGDERYLGFPGNKTPNRNTYTDDIVTKGIIQSQDDPILEALFTPEDGIGRKYLGSGDHLFLYDSDGSATGGRGYGEGYYYYDSDYNGADYDQANQRFYVYDHPQIIEQDGQSHQGFMPFEQRSTSDMKINAKGDQTDYWFGTRTTIDFYLPDDAGSRDGKGNQSAAHKDLRFHFSGDDDVWIFVDDKLVLDLGGIHQRRGGDINFATGAVQYLNVANDGTESVSETDMDALSGITSGDHTLTIYYLERGSSWSNCSIYFNLVPSFNLELTKVDPDQEITLSDAEFSFYLDPACSVPASLYDSEGSDRHKKSRFRTDENGILKCYGLRMNRTYYMKESKAPPGYPNVSDQVIAITIDESGQISIPNTDAEYADLTMLDGSTIGLTVKNRKPQLTEITAEKKWYDSKGNPADEDLPESVSVRLYRSRIPDQMTGSPGARIPIQITTQYFGENGGADNDAVGVTAGDLQKALLVPRGGGLLLSLDLASSEDGYQTGIYSVTVNGSELDPVSMSGQTDLDCYISGEWDQHPPTHGEYVLPSITEASSILITCIGYLKDGGSSLADSLTLDTQIQPPESGSTDPPALEDAEPVGDAVLLTADNDWKYTWTELSARDEDKEAYYYYVQETELPGYTVSYSGNGSRKGTILVHNVKDEKPDTPPVIITPATLPDTGGAGSNRFTILGLLLILCGTGLWFRARWKDRRLIHKTMLMLMFLTLSSVPALATDGTGSLPDVDHPCTLTLCYVMEDDAQSTPIANARFAICQIANLQTHEDEIRYEMLPEFSPGDKDLGTLNASESAALARRYLSEASSQKLFWEIKVTDSAGTIRFSELKPGAYLLAQIEDAVQADKHYYSDPFLVMLPDPDPKQTGREESWNYDVVAAPKLEAKETPVHPESQESRETREENKEIQNAKGKSKSNKLQNKSNQKTNVISTTDTGDNTQIYEWGITLMASALVLAALVHKKRKEDE